MGDVIRFFQVRSAIGERSKRLRLYFDTGSPYTFIKHSAAKGFRQVISLSPPEGFGGLGNGRFKADRMMHLQVRMLGIWCRHAAYVVSDDVLDERYDLLVGHDFMQKFDVGLASKKRDVILDRGALKMAQTVRRARSGSCGSASLSAGRPGGSN